MSTYRLLFVMTICAAIICQSCTYGGPARSFASIVAARSAKIPRSIRAPFRNTEMMTARGFGKRSQGTETAWNFSKGDTKYLDSLGVDGTDVLDQTYSDQLTESFSLDWLAHEMAGNPLLSRNILERFVDINHDGIITARELLSSPQKSFDNQNNDVF